jgi:hypothetical protein
MINCNQWLLQCCYSLSWGDCMEHAKFWNGICMIHKLLNFFVSEVLLKGAWTECQKFFEMPLLWATLAIGEEKSHVKGTPIPELTGSWRSTR